MKREPNGKSRIKSLSIETLRVDAICSETQGGEEHKVTIHHTEGLALELIFDSENEARVTAVLSVPEGFLHQLRLITDGVKVGLYKNSSTVMAKVPSGTQTGIKINPKNKIPFEIQEGKITL